MVLDEAFLEEFEAQQLEVKCFKAFKQIAHWRSGIW